MFFDSPDAAARVGVEGITVAKWIVLGIRILTLAVVATFAWQGWRRFRETMEKGEPRVDSTWGGFGGTLGGWSVSKSMAWLLVTLVTLVLFAVLALQVGEPLTKSEPGQAEEKSKAGQEKPAETPAKAEPKKPADSAEPSGGEAKESTPPKTNAAPEKTGGTKPQQPPKA